MEKIRCRLLLLVALAAGPARAQGTATLSGIVTGPDGARLPHVVVRIELPERAVQVVSGELGAYRAGNLAAGSCTVRAELPGFAPAAVPDVLLAAGEARTLDLQLRVATVSESAVVIGAAPRDSLEAAAIRESPARDVGEALAETPGLWKLRKGGIANDISLRGLQSRDLSVLIDGQRIHGACPNHMDPPAFHVDFSEVDRIEIAKGPFDVKNQGSLGGVVNVVTRSPEKGWHFTPNLAVGSYGFWNPSASVSRGGERVSALAGYSYRASGPYTDGDGKRFTERANYKTTAQGHDAFGIGTAWGRLAVVPAAGQLLEVAYTRQDAGEALYPYLLMDAITDVADRVNVRYEAPRLAEGRGGVLAQAYFSQVDHWMTDQERVSSVGTPRGYSMGTMARTSTVGGKLEGRRGAATAGVEAYRRTWDSTTEMAMMKYAEQASLPGVDVDVMGAYAELIRAAGPRLTVTAGARIDRARSEADAARADPALYLAYHGTRQLSRTDTLPSGKLRLEYRPAAGVELSAGIGHAARLPEANERYFSLRRAGTDWVGDPGLDPARNTGLDVSVSFARSRLSLRGSAFLNQVDGFITVTEQARLQVVPGVMNARARTWANVDAKLRGGELAATFTLTDRLVVSSDLSYVRGTQTPVPELGVLSSDLPEIPPLRATGRLRYDDGRLFASLEGVLVDGQDDVASELHELPTPGYALASFSAGLRRGPLVAAVGVANLFDRTYAEHLSYQRDPFRSGVIVNEPGRNLFANVTYRF
jgi:iron complex outermembrane receptor protein